MTATERGIREGIWDAVFYLEANKWDTNMTRYYIGKLAGIRFMLPYVYHEISSEAYAEFNDITLRIILGD